MVAATRNHARRRRGEVEAQSYRCCRMLVHRRRGCRPARAKAAADFCTIAGGVAGRRGRRQRLRALCTELRTGNE